ncbi:hypothetical protein GONAM_02_00240 [Gordonia namibiensis NBRC 108229]|uniref:5-methylcytosine-specific restriction enzyme subunit McrC n=1 Tax=Gordonia namibiensis NBRC 108229 TaxID=1208314 RepID=K6X2A2_9ACTN|nr:hypothetical protein [Gordonia namibiensis]GAB98502.1 hypothetical protein GONAM_02_00240 [Gordonia namibiensis NBRC 108229]
MLNLTEHQRGNPVALTLSQQRQVREIFDARFEPAENGCVRVIPGARVGAATVDDLHIVVTPKVPVFRIIHMIGVAADPFGWRPDDVAGLSATSVTDAIAALFARACIRAFGFGIYRTYRTERLTLSHVKGRIDVARYIRSPLPVPVPVDATVHDDHTAENQVLRAACDALRRLSELSTRTHTDLASVWKVVREVGLLHEPLRTAQQIVWSRHNAHYRTAVRLAELVLRSQSVTITSGTVPVPGFVLNMPSIVENYVRALIREELGADDTEMPTSWKGRLTLDRGRQIGLIPDLGMRRNGRWEFIGDVKYKVAQRLSADQKHEQGRQDDLYQLHAYVTEAGLDEGTLVYAGMAQSEVVHTVRATGARLRVVAVDLTADDIDAQVRGVVRVEPGRTVHLAP